jgi:hypothetical protein
LVDAVRTLEGSCEMDSSARAVFPPAASLTRVDSLGGSESPGSTLGTCMGLAGVGVPPDFEGDGTGFKELVGVDKPLVALGSTHVSSLIPETMSWLG